MTHPSGRPVPSVIRCLTAGPERVAPDNDWRPCAVACHRFTRAQTPREDAKKGVSPRRKLVPPWSLRSWDAVNVEMMPERMTS